MRSWNNEFSAEGICTNAVNPGPIRTDMFESGMDDTFKAWLEKNVPVAYPSDISDVVLFLASKESRWVTGSIVSTNRGILHF